MVKPYMVGTIENPLTSRVGAKSAKSGAPGSVFVLVHGGWHGGWCWQAVAKFLRQEGHEVFTPTLSGLGERSHLLTGATDVSLHVADICNVLTWEDLDNVILVGHSYGGMVISGVAEKMPDRISAIVFLDAFVPADREAMIDKIPVQIGEALRDLLAQGGVSVASPSSERFGVSGDLKAWVDSKLTPQPLATFFEKVEYSGGRDRITKKVFIRLADYQNAVLDIKYAEAKAREDWLTLELAAGHDVMITNPRLLARSLLAVA